MLKTGRVGLNNVKQLVSVLTVPVWLVLVPEGCSHGNLGYTCLASFP